MGNLNNKDVQENLTKKILHELGFAGKKDNEIRIGLLEKNDYSICFPIDILHSSSIEGYYVKIPKKDMVFIGSHDIMPLTDDDRIFGENEYKSLMYLKDYWNTNDAGISFIKPELFVKDYNAIVTWRVYGDDFFKFFRKQDLSRKLSVKHRPNHIHGSFQKVGRALSRFHKHSEKENLFETEKIMKKIENYCSQIETVKSNKQFLNKTYDSIQKIIAEYPFRTHIACTLKGLDIRNILIDKDGNLFMLDPGKMKEDCVEGDLARFIVTCRILYWGSMTFFLRLCPDPSYERSFLEGYYGGRVEKNNLLILMTIKELLKHWCMAYAVVRIKTWPAWLKYFLKFSYIDPFYRGQIEKEVLKLG